MTHDDPSANRSRIKDWLIFGCAAASTIGYFANSEAVRGEFLFLFESFLKVLARLGVHA